MYPRPSQLYHENKIHKKYLFKDLVALIVTWFHFSIFAPQQQLHIQRNSFPNQKAQDDNTKD